MVVVAANVTSAAGGRGGGPEKNRRRSARRQQQAQQAQAQDDKEPTKQQQGQVQQEEARSTTKAAAAVTKTKPVPDDADMSPVEAASKSGGDYTLVVEIPTHPPAATRGHRRSSPPASAGGKSSPLLQPSNAKESPMPSSSPTASVSVPSQSSSSSSYTQVAADSASTTTPSPAAAPPPQPIRRSGRARASISTRTADFISLSPTTSPSTATSFVSSSSSSSAAAAAAAGPLSRGSPLVPGNAKTSTATSITSTSSAASATAGPSSQDVLPGGSKRQSRIPAAGNKTSAVSSPSTPLASSLRASAAAKGKRTLAAASAAAQTPSSTMGAATATPSHSRTPSSSSSRAPLAATAAVSNSTPVPVTSTFTPLSTPTSSHGTRSNKSTSVIPFPPLPLPIALTSPPSAVESSSSALSLREEDTRDEKLMAVCAALDALGNRALSAHEIADVCVANDWLRPSPAVAAHTLVSTAIRNYHRRCQYATPTRRPIIQKHMLQGCVAETRLASALHPQAFEDGKKPKGAVWFLEGSLRGHCWTNPLTLPLKSMQNEAEQQEEPSKVPSAGSQQKGRKTAKRKERSTKARTAAAAATTVKVEEVDKTDMDSVMNGDGGETISSVHKRMIWPSQHCIDFEVDSSGDSDDDDMDDPMDNERGRSLFSSSSSLSSLPRSFGMSRIAPAFPHRDSLHPSSYQQDVSVPMLSPYRVEDSSSSSEEDELAEDIQIWDHHAAVVRARHPDGADFDADISALRVSMADLDAASTPAAVTATTAPSSILSSSITSDYLTKIRVSPVDEEELHTAVETLGCLLPSPGGDQSQSMAMDVDHPLSTTPTESPLRSFPLNSAAMKLSLPLAGTGLASPLPSPSIASPHAFFGSPQACRAGTASPMKPHLDLPAAQQQDIEDADLLSDLSRQLAIGGVDSECVCKCETPSNYESSSSSSQHSLASSIRSPLRGGKSRSPVASSPRRDASKNIFKLLGPESVGVDELDVVWGPQISPHVEGTSASSSNKPRSNRQRSGSTGEWGHIGVGKQEEDRIAFAQKIDDHVVRGPGDPGAPHPTPIVEEDEDAFGMNDLDDACLAEWAERDDLPPAETERSPVPAWTPRAHVGPLSSSSADSPSVIDPCTLAMSPDAFAAAASPPLSTAQSPPADDAPAMVIESRRPMTPSMSPQAEEPVKIAPAPAACAAAAAAPPLSRPSTALRANGRSVMVPPTNPVFPKVWATVVDSIPVFAITWQNKTLLRRVDSDYINLTQFLSTTPFEKPEVECARLEKLPSSVSVPTHPVPAVRGLWVPMSQAMEVADKTVVDDDLKKVLFNDQLAQLFPRPLPQVKAAFCSVAASRQSTNGPILPFGLPFGASVTSVDAKNKPITATAAAAATPRPPVPTAAAPANVPRRTSTPAPVTKRPSPPASSPAPAAKRRKSCVAESKPKIAAAPTTRKA